MKAYGYAEQEGRGRHEFDRWVASAGCHGSAMEAFREFEHRFSQLSEWERRSVGAAKVLLFFKTVHHEERLDILFELQDDYGAHGLTEVCSPRSGPKWNGCVGNMMRGGWPQHGPRAAEEREW